MKHEAEVKARWGDRVGGWILALSDEPQSTRAWAIGAEGEEKLARALDGIGGVRFLHDRAVRGSKKNIDHIVVAPAGIFVMDAKRYKGLIEIRNRGPIWRRERRLFVGGRDRTVLAEGMGWQVEAVRSALSRSDVEPPPPITAVLCFIDGEWPLFRPPKEFEGVRLETERSIRKLLNASEMLGAEEIVRLAGILAAALPSK